MKKILITGGAGFIGTNTSLYFLKEGYEVTVFDNLSRRGADINLRYIKKQYPNARLLRNDIRNVDAVKKAVKGKDIVIHLAGQVAVTTSVKNPYEDFEVNLLGTVNILEALRKYNPSAVLLYSSTNKVYGDLSGDALVEMKTRYKYKSRLLKDGIPETYPLSFHSPYGCSKGSGDQYVLDYSRTYGISTIVFRQSCIYGPYQFGIEDQGWVAWFILAALFRRKITIFGDGKQVRDILYIDDLVKAYDLAIKNIQRTRGQVYNIGGGIKNSISIWGEFKPILESLLSREIKAKFDISRLGDQKIYISCIKKANKDFGWYPRVSAKKGIKLLYEWILKNKIVIQEVYDWNKKTV